MRELIDSDKKKLRALILVDVILVAAVTEARGRSVFPGNDVLRGVVTFVPRARHVPPEVRKQRRLEFRKGSPQQERVTAGDFTSLHDRFKKQRFGFARACRAAQ